MVKAANPNDLAEQNLTPGDLAFEDGKTISLPADPSADFISGGTPVAFDANGYIEPMEGGDYTAGDELLGIVQPQADESDALRDTDERGDDNWYSVHLDRLPIVVDLGEAATRGDEVQTDGAGGYEVATGGSHVVVKATDEDANEYAILK